MIRFCLLLLVLVQVLPAAAYELRATVTHLATDAVFIDQGSLAGLRTGDLGLYTPPGKPAVELEVIHLSSTRASLRLPEDPLGLKAGETVVFRLPEERRVEQSAAPAVTEPVVEETRPVREPRKHSLRDRRLAGNLSLEHREQRAEVRSWDRSLRGSLQVRNLGHASLELRSRFRLRQEQPETGAERWTSRVPLLELAWNPADRPWALRLGRLAGAGNGRAGSLDGLELVTHGGGVGQWQAWAGVGSNGINDRPDGRLQRTGLGWSREGEWGSGRLESSLALAGSYREGQVEREFLAQRLEYRRVLAPGRFSLGQELELDHNRGWRAEHRARLGLARFDLRLRQALGTRVTVSGGWRYQQSPLTLEQQSLADSLLALHESGSLSLGCEWRARQDLSVSLEGSRLRDREGLREGRSLRLGLRHSALPLGLQGGLQARLYHNSLSDTRTLQGDLARTLGRDTRLVLRAGQQTVEQGLVTGTGRWLGLALDQTFGRRTFLRLEGELERDNRQQDRRSARLELGRRF